MRKQKILAALTACGMLCAAAAVLPEMPEQMYIAASAEETAEYTEGTYELLTYRNYGDHIEIIGCDESATEVVIPSEIDGVPVTGICSIDNMIMMGFSNCQALTSVVIPDSVKSIGSNAFFACTNLTLIDIPDSVTSIGGGAFAYTPWMQNQVAQDPLFIVNGILLDGSECTGDVVVPDGVTWIADGAFNDNWNLNSIALPEGVTHIGKQAFRQCGGLLSVVIPDTVTCIGECAFEECSSLKSITIPDSVTIIEYAAFYKSGLISAELPNNLTTIPTWAFSGTSLTSVTIPDGVTNIENGAFQWCTDLAEINFPESVTSFGCDALSETLWLEQQRAINPLVIVNDVLIDGTTCSGDVQIPDNVTKIEEYAFYGCNTMNTVVIPKSVTNIDMLAFGDCTGLTDVYYVGTEEEWNTICVEFDMDPFLELDVNIHYNYIPPTPLGNLNGDASIDATDASMILVAATNIGADLDSGLTAEQIAAADLNGDGAFDAVDASIILQYATYVGTGGDLSVEEFIAQG